MLEGFPELKVIPDKFSEEEVGIELWATIPPMRLRISKEIWSKRGEEEVLAKVKELALAKFREELSKEGGISEKLYI